MSKSENKTKPEAIDPAVFISDVPNPQRRADAELLLPLFTRVTGWNAQMWGSNIVGFGRYEYKYASGREGEFMVTGFSPRASYTSLYIMPAYQDMSETLARLGPHKAGKSCINIKRLDLVDLAVVEEIIREGVDDMIEKYEVFPS
ncbi:MAG: DUF1801 domain-containing protein [Litoreibacter sp.]|nr:DUF1801 domain-containing protein [Litoreibacter sp.]MCY4335583.1 DUF1801 domain-containing protein [Litoreibacter sp.]